MSIVWLICVSVPAVGEVCLGHVGDAAVDPGILEEDVVVVVADSHHIVSVLEIDGVRSRIIIVFPSLDEHNHWPRISYVILKHPDCHIFLEFAAEAQLRCCSKQLLRHRADFLISLREFGQIHLSEILFAVVAEHSGEAGRTASVVSSLVNIRHIQQRNIFGLRLHQQIAVGLDDGGIVELSTNSPACIRSLSDDNTHCSCHRYRKQYDICDTCLHYNDYMTASLAFLAHRHEHLLQSSVRNIPIPYGFLQVVLLKPVGLLGFKHLDDLQQVLELVYSDD